MKKLGAPLSLLALLLTLASCSGCTFGLLSGPGSSLTILTYNVENLFDDVDNGTEYREYDPSGGNWNSELFHRKLQRVAEVLRAASPGGADIVALQEVENEKALASLNDLYLKGMGYRAILGTSEGSAACVALLCRLPISRVQLHRIAADEPLRTVLEVEVDSGGTPIVLFVNHWKSKEGDGEATESLRRATAAAVARRIADLRTQEPQAGVLVVGDLNEQYDEFTRNGGRYRTALMPIEASAAAVAPASTCDGSLYLFGALDCSQGQRTPPDEPGGRVALYDPWAQAPGQGSIWYAGGWETIDHVLVGPSLLGGTGLRYDGFAVVRLPFMLDAAGCPLRFSPQTGGGYSDHLPLLLTLRQGT